jgi:hypothetical protein
LADNERSGEKKTSDVIKLEVLRRKGGRREKEHF